LRELVENLGLNDSSCRYDAMRKKRKYCWLFFQANRWANIVCFRVVCNLP